MFKESTFLAILECLAVGPLSDGSVGILVQMIVFEYYKQSNTNIYQK